MSIESHEHRRRFPRIHGPFNAWRLDAVRTHIRIIDLGLGGCFVTGAPPTNESGRFTMSIDLGIEGVVEVLAAALYHRPHGSAVTFDDLTSDVHARIGRTVAAAANRLLVSDDGALRHT
jgi:hypothetical protein